MNTNMEKLLFIDDFVTKKDVPIVIDYFIKFGIATVENVEFTLHPESEYNAAYTDDYPNIYGSLIIYIKDWFTTQTAINFYERLTLNTCKIVYDDPEYFNVYLYSKYFNLELLDNETSQYNEENTTFNDVSLNTTTSQEYNSENVEVKQEEEQKQEQKQEEQQEDIFVFESEEEEEEEKDDNKDLNYIYSSDNDERDDYYEYYEKDKKPKKSNKRKRTINPDVNLDNVSTDVLKSVLIKRNKNYLKNNKAKPYKNVWSRRLRQKQEI